MSASGDYGNTFKTDSDNGEPPPPDLYAECDSDETINAIIASLEEKFVVFPVESDEWAFESLKKVKPDLVFNISERLFGPNRESHIPTLCEILGIPYTGSDPLTLGICLDKSRTKEILSYHNIPNPKFWIAESPSALPDSVEMPAIIKPLYEGSSKGIRNNSVVRSRSEMSKRIKDVITRYRQPVIIEQFLSGREFTIGVLGNYPNLEILPIVEIDHSQLPKGATPIYSYEAKWIWDQPHQPLKIFDCPAKITYALKNQIEELIRRTVQALKLKDWCRIDVRLDQNSEPNILEVNPLPGILPNPEDNSCLPKAARSSGYSYSTLIHRVVEEAILRYGLITTALDGKERKDARKREKSYVYRHRLQHIPGITSISQ
ncbi:MAG: ATP-grasp domain-containing protein [Candidatus Aminicenantes bacterium]|nr:ATP-grasp domain-containing protein [Candidatus Aminicenantes bacterium]